MFKIKWDHDNNGVILSEYIEENEALNAPRPVYVEELKMLELDKAFVLPNENVAVCWEIDRKYYYCGEVIAETRRGNIYEDPTVIVYEEYRGTRLSAIDIKKLVEVNRKMLEVAENEAMDFIKARYEEYQNQKKGNIAGFVVAFSGGKDSQVILDIVSRVIPHEKFTPVFTNTGMELPCTLQLMETTETYLYMYKNGVEINPAYTLGLTRVGCGVCPFASDWSEYVIRKRYPQIAKDYISVVEDMARNIGITSKSKIDEYVSSGNWKKNAGGKGLLQDASRMDIISKEPNFECIVQNPKVDWEKWFSTIGEYFLEKIDSDYYRGELKFEGDVVKFEVRYGENSVRFKAISTTNRVMLISYLTRAFTKTAYCELCGVCEIECPTGALTVRDSVEIDKTKCVHCHNCFEINTKGCIIATRKMVYGMQFRFRK